MFDLPAPLKSPIPYWAIVTVASSFLYQISHLHKENRVINNWCKEYNTSVSLIWSSFSLFNISPNLEDKKENTQQLKPNKANSTPGLFPFPNLREKNTGNEVAKQGIIKKENGHFMKFSVPQESSYTLQKNTEKRVSLQREICLLLNVLIFSRISPKHIVMSTRQTVHIPSTENTRHFKNTTQHLSFEDMFLILQYPLSVQGCSLIFLLYMGSIWSG